MRERRNRVRLPLPAEVMYRCSDGPLPPRAAQTNEISAQGMRFITTESLNPGTVLELTLTLATLFEPLVATAKVLWQRRVSSQFLLDTCVQFIRVEPPDVIRLMETLYRVARETVAGRRYVRVALVVDVFCALREHPRQAQRGVSADIGVGGMRMFLPEPLVVSTLVTLNFCIPGVTAETLSVPGRVLWEKSKPEYGYETGVAFVSLPPEITRQILTGIEHRLAGGEASI